MGPRDERHGAKGARLDHARTAGTGSATAWLRSPSLPSAFRWGAYTRGVPRARAASLDFARDGAVGIGRFLSRSEVNDLRRETDVVLDGPIPLGCERPNNTLAPLRWDDAIIHHVLGSEHRRKPDR